MSENLSVVYLRDGDPYWLDAGVTYALADEASGALERLSQSLAERDHGVVFAAPGSDVRLLELTVTPEEKKHLNTSLPFMLEESLSGNIEDVHFARNAIDKEQYAIAMVDKSSMTLWEGQLEALNAPLPWIPEPLLLPWTSSEWTMVIEAETTLLRYGRNAGTRIENTLLPTLVGALLEEDSPDRVIVYGDQESLDSSFLMALKAVEVQWRTGGFSQALMLRDGSEPTLNLLQGEFAPQLPYARWWGQWRKVAALFLLALSIHLLSGWLDLQRMERENLVLRTEIESVYRGVNPRGAIVDAEKQLRRQLDGLRGGTGGGSFTGLLAPVGTSLSSQDEMLLASLSYSQRNAELRVNLLAADFADVESLRGSLEQAGYSATLESSSRSGDRVRARLRVGERP
ncbi:type II secretion system protein GspL [Congregibacter brevis]|uniref:Type II secretion system protein L n=1 Tax=Congregibacter brevis TaxID=3081201 RepID=A0ABZ0IHC9_9GAMM|nr:type II secretion system protein GspL [Congregibacter sp. IMCC45268]